MSCCVARLPDRNYLVEPTGAFEDDPNVTNKKFPGNATQSYRTRDHNYGGRKAISVQYWRSFNRIIKDSGDIGIWHETYRVHAGDFESIYANMPEIGLAAAAASVQVDRGSTAATRNSARDADEAPVSSY